MNIFHAVFLIFVHIYTYTTSFMFRQMNGFRNDKSDAKFIDMVRDTIRLLIIDKPKQFTIQQTHETIPPGGNSMITIKPVSDSVDIDENDKLIFNPINSSDTLVFKLPILNR